MVHDVAQRAQSLCVSDVGDDEDGATSQNLFMKAHSKTHELSRSELGSGYAKTSVVTWVLAKTD